MRQNETATASRSDAEDRIHRGLALLLGALAGAVLLLREPTAPRPDANVGAATGAREPDAPRRAALETAIAELVRWFERTPDDARTPLDANLRLLALGRAALQPEPARSGAVEGWQNLDALARRAQRETTPGNVAAGTATGASAAGATAARATGATAAGATGATAAGAEAARSMAERDAGPAATLSILLETGARLDEELALPSGTTRVRALLELALAATGERRSEVDPWSLDLLSFAVLAGMPYRRELERQVVTSLARLEREQRQLTGLMGDGAAAAGALQALASELGARRDDGGGWARELQLSAAVFRAVAVLAEPELEQRALRHLNALLFRQQLERDLRRERLVRAQTARERVAVRVDALEALGRLEQALYGAHLAFRHEARPGPAPRTASSMRHAASELLAELDALKKEGAFAPGSHPATELTTAAAHALRGLRVARVAL